jgi:kynureninase
MGSVLPSHPVMTLEKPSFPPGADTEEYALSLDAEDHLQSFRDKFIIPSKGNIKSKKLVKPGWFKASSIISVCPNPARA